jgi:hypothetical protein
MTVINVIKSARCQNNGIACFDEKSKIRPTILEAFYSWFTA